MKEENPIYKAYTERIIRLYKWCNLREYPHLVEILRQNAGFPYELFDFVQNTYQNINDVKVLNIKRYEQGCPDYIDFEIEDKQYTFKDNLLTKWFIIHFLDSKFEALEVYQEQQKAADWKT